MTKERLIYIFFLLFTSVLESNPKNKLFSPSSSLYYHTTRPTRFQIPFTSPHKVYVFLNRIFEDFCSVGKEIISVDSMKVVAGTAPFYLIGRRADKSIHKKFYNAETHTNIHQPSSFITHLLLHAAPVIPAVTYGAMGSLHEDPYARRTAQVFISGYLWTWGTKILLKMFKISSNLRPCNGNFDTISTHGGNPSGHTSTAAFYTTYLGLTRGPRWAVPLGVLTAGVGTLGFVTNRHYFSQVVAGAGLGIVIGYATHRVLEHIPEQSDLNLSFSLAGQRGPGLTFAYNF
jgi:hypothetical protein